MKTILFVTVILGAGLVFGNDSFPEKGSSNRAVQDAPDVIFSNFIAGHMKRYLSNITEPMLVPNFDYQFNSSIYGYTGSGNASAAVSGLSNFLTSASSNIVGKILYFRVYMFPNIWTVTGNYSLAGTVDDLFIVHGNGPYNQSTSHVDWNDNAKLEIDANGYVTIIDLIFRNMYDVESTFQGIENEEIVGPYIGRYLDHVGSEIFDLTHQYVAERVQTDLIAHVNAVLQTITLDEILGNETQPPSTTTTEIPTTSTAPEEEVVVDIGSDLPNSGWTVSSTSTCGYANVITGFYCNGSPVGMSGPYEGTGFWMSPCPGDCTLEYEILNNEAWKQLRFSAFYNDIDSESRIVVQLSRNSDTQEFVFTRGDGSEVEIDLSGSSYQKISVSLINNGRGLFSVLDRLTLSK